MVILFAVVTPGKSSATQSHANNFLFRALRPPFFGHPERNRGILLRNLGAIRVALNSVNPGAYLSIAVPANCFQYLARFGHFHLLKALSLSIATFSPSQFAHRNFLPLNFSFSMGLAPDFRKIFATAIEIGGEPKTTWSQ
jgi:hypothetical protein